VVIIPLRKQLIEIERLRFPSGVAVATILKSPGAGAAKAKLLELFQAIGLEDPWVAATRRRLSAILFG